MSNSASSWYLFWTTLQIVATGYLLRNGYYSELAVAAFIYFGAKAQWLLMGIRARGEAAILLQQTIHLKAISKKLNVTADDLQAVLDNERKLNQSSEAKKLIDENEQWLRAI